jgi:hypothetical protein
MRFRAPPVDYCRASFRVQSPALPTARPDQVFFLPPVAAFFTGLLSVAAGFFWSPSVAVAGQILKIGHFLQPATIATGQITMMSSLGGIARSP